jgi:hypothetical protein
VADLCDLQAIVSSGSAVTSAELGSPNLEVRPEAPRMNVLGSGVRPQPDCSTVRTVGVVADPTVEVEPPPLEAAVRPD